MPAAGTGRAALARRAPTRRETAGQGVPDRAGPPPSRVPVTLVGNERGGTTRAAERPEGPGSAWRTVATRVDFRPRTPHGPRARRRGARDGSCVRPRHDP